MSISIKLPDFNHPEVCAFYEHDLSIPKEKVAQILQLPRATLIEDMETIIMDNIQRDEYFRNYEDEDNWLSFNMHAMWVLAELEAKEALPTLLEVLKQNDDFSEHWFSDYSTEGLWEMYYHLGKDRLDTLKEVLLKPGYWVFRIIPSHVAKEIALHHPERKQEVLDWFGSVLDAFIEMEDDDKALDGDTISTVIVDLIGIQAKELLPQIKILYDKGAVFNGITGDFQSIEQGINHPKYKGEKGELKPSIYDRYEDAMTWYGYQMKYNPEAYKEKHTPKKTPALPPVIQKPAVPILLKQVSKNAPCPCGSGKKYKRCCLKK
ncbi:MAG: DUF1186 domain-containing protein [Chitinophagales bacterium]